MNSRYLQTHTLINQTIENQHYTTAARLSEELKNRFFFRTLTPAPKQSMMYHAHLKFDSYSHLIFTVKDLLQIAVHTLQNSGSENSGSITEPAIHLSSLLEIAVQLLPCPEGEALDVMHQLDLELERNQEQHENLKKSKT